MVLVALVALVGVGGSEPKVALNNSFDADRHVVSGQQRLALAMIG